MGRASKRASSERAVGTPKSSRLPGISAASGGPSSPDEKTSKKPRFATPAPVREAVKPPAEVGEEQEPEEERAEEAEVDEEDVLLTREQRAEAAAETWFGEAGKAEDLTSSSFDPAMLFEKADRLPFRLVALALEEFGNGARFLRSLANVIRWVFSRSTDKQSDIEDLFTILVERDVAMRMLQRYLVDAIASAFGLKEMAVAAAKALPPSELADTALAARNKQRTLFGAQARLLGVAEIAALVKEHAPLRMRHVRAHPGFTEGLRRLLGKSAAEGRETWHLVRLLQCRCCPGTIVALRALAQAYSLSFGGAAPLLQDTVAGPGRAAFAECMVEAEDAILRGYGEVAGQCGKLAGVLLGEQALARLPELCSAECGSQVLPMQATASQTAAEAIEALGAGALLAEGQLDGERVQLHARRSGAEVQVFSDSQGEWTERIEEVGAALTGRLEGAADCILEAVLMKPPRAAPKKAAKEEAHKEGEDGKTDGKATVPKEPEAPKEIWETSTTVVLFDILALNGRPLTRMPLRQRRAALQKVLHEGPCLKLARSTEIPSDAVNVERVKMELGKALTTHYTVDACDRSSTTCKGLILKHLDGPQAEYFAGFKSSGWQAVMNPPITGAEAEARLFAGLNEREAASLASSDVFHFCVVSARRTNTPEGVKDVLNVESQFRAAGVQPTWYVDAASLEGYRALGLKAIVGGKLIPARNLALEDAAQLEKVCVQISDDIARWEYYQGDGKQKSLHEANAAAKRAERLQVSPVAAARFILAKMRGVQEGDCRPRLGGVYPLGNMGHAFHTEEFALRNFILGDFFVADGSPCRFDGTMSLKEDYDYTCSHLSTHGAVMRCNRMVINAKHETNAGGACTVRDAAGERERENIRILQQKWPGAIWSHPTRPNQVVLRWEMLKREGKAKRGA